MHVSYTLKIDKCTSIYLTPLKQFTPHHRPRRFTSNDAQPKEVLVLHRNLLSAAWSHKARFDGSKPTLW